MCRSVSVFNTTELYSSKWFGWQVLYFVYFITILKYLEIRNSEKELGLANKIQ